MAIEVIKREDGTYGWRIRQDDGSYLKIKPGYIYLPHDPEADERSFRAVQHALERRYREQTTRTAGR